MRLACIAGWALSLLAAACGRREEPSAYPWEAPGRRLRLLDPGGRLYDGPDVSWFVRTSEGAWVGLPLRRFGQSSWGYDASGLAAGTDVSVVSPGCRVERAVVGVGETFVRLRAGLAVPLRIEWDGTLPEPLLRLGVSLERRRVGGGLGLEPMTLVSRGARTVDDDFPSPPDWTDVVPGEPVLLLYVPEEGPYTLRWECSYRNGGGSITTSTTVTVGPDGNSAPVSVAPPGEWIGRMASRVGGGGR